MITLENVTIDTLGVGNRRLQWEVVPTHEDLNNYTLDLYRAEAPGLVTEFEVMASGVSVLDGTYIDSGLQRMDYSTNRQIYYYLNIVNNVTPAISLDGPYVMKSEPDYVSNEILRRYGIFFDNPRYQTRTFHVLKKRTWGNTCSCVDSVTQEVRDENCEICYGTSFEGGYFAPIAVRGMRSDKPSRQMINLFGAWHDTNVFFKLQNTIDVVPGDIIVDEHNERYLIEGPVNHLQKGIYTLLSNVRAKTLSKSDPIYRYGMVEELGGTIEDVVVSGNEIAYFNGTSAYMETVDNDLLSFLDNSFSITGWFESDVVASGLTNTEIQGATSFESAGTYEQQSFTMSNGNVLVVYDDAINFYTHYTIVSQSGTEVLAPTQIETGYATNISFAQLSDKNVYVFYDTGTPTYVIMNEAGIISAGPTQIPGIVNPSFLHATALENDNIFVAYCDNDDLEYGHFVILDSAMNIVVSSTAFTNYKTYSNRPTLLQNGNVFVPFNNDTDFQGEFIIFSPAGAVVKSATIFNVGKAYDVRCSVLTGGNVLISYSDVTNGLSKFAIYDEDGNLIKGETEYDPNAITYNSVAPTKDNQGVIFYEHPITYQADALVVDSVGNIVHSKFNVDAGEIYDPNVVLLGNGNIMMLYDVYNGGDTGTLKIYDVIGPYHPLLVKDDKDTKYEWILVYDNLGNMHIRLIGGPTNFIGKYYNYPFDGSLHHYAVTYDGSGSSEGIKLYIDNALVSTNTNNLGIYTTPINTDLSMLIGKWGDSFFEGRARDIKIFNKTLTTSDINQEYTLGNYTVGMIVNYKLHENTDDYGRYNLDGINNNIIFTQE